MVWDHRGKAVKVALYARVSSEGQADRGTIEAQADYLRRYVALNGMDVVGEYFDEAVHGPIPLREQPAGRRLVKDAQAKKFTKVHFYRVDRFARSLKELLEAEALMTSLGVDLQSANEPFDTAAPMGRFMFQLLGGIAELEKSVILERTINGRAPVAKDGRWAGGPPPYGYAIVEGRLARREPEASVVRDLFEAIANGGTMRREAHRLNEAEILGRQGKPWTEGRLSKLVHCQTYKGTHIFRSRDGILSRDVPAIVSPETWEAAHVQLKRNSVQQPTYRFNLLRGKLRCVNCGGVISVQKRPVDTKSTIGVSAASVQVLDTVDRLT
jgi:site-specific DNA recombinase